MACGDHLFYYRAGTVYSHHGIDCGDGTVIHFESSLGQKLAAQAHAAQKTVREATGRAHQERTPRIPSIVRSNWDEFAQGAEVYIRDYATCEAQPASEVLARAESRLGSTDYNLWGNNCEHFAVWCKTGVADSTQVRALREANKAFWNASPMTVAMLRAARRLPPKLRGLAYTGAAAVSGTSYVATYLRHRFQHQRDRLS